MRFMLSLIFVALMPSLAVAKPYTAENYLKVWAIDPVSFEVIEARGEGARGLWCAAASFAERILRIHPTTLLYVQVPRGPSISHPGRNGVVFTTDPATLPQGAVQAQRAFATTRDAGVYFPSYLARTFCRDRFGERDLWDRF